MSTTPVVHPYFPPQAAALALAGSDLVPLGGMTRAQAEALIADRVLLLLRGSLERLTQLLYRLDVPEPAALRALRLKDEPAAAAELARLIVDRELRKAWTREHYRSRMARYEQELGADME